LRAAYAIGREGKLKLLLSQNDASRVRRLLAYHGYLGKAREKRIAEIRASQERLERLLAERHSEVAQLEQDQLAQHDEEIALEAARQRRAGLLARERQRVESRSERLRRLERDRKRLRALLARLEKEAANRDLSASLGTPFAARKGKLPWPLAGRPRAAPDAGGGVLIPAPAGAPVHAIHRGRIAFADWLRGYGLLTIIDHGDGFLSLYGHNQALYKEVGQWVEAGETIASAGNSGGKRSAGVYFAIRKQGKAVDPRRWCRRAPRR